MAYITQDMIEDHMAAAEFRRLCDDNGDGTADADVVTHVIGHAESELNRWFMQRYAVPLSLGDATTAEVVRSAALDCAEFQAHKRRPPVPADVLAAYQQAIEWAQKVAAGEIGLAGETLRSSGLGGGAVTIDAATRVIDRDAMSGL